MEFGERAKTIREEAGLTQETFGERIEASSGTVSKWESGETQRVLSVSLHEINFQER